MATLASIAIVRQQLALGLELGVSDEEIARKLGIGISTVRAARAGRRRVIDVRTADGRAQLDTARLARPRALHPEKPKPRSRAKPVRAPSRTEQDKINATLREIGASIRFLAEAYDEAVLVAALAAQPSCGPLLSALAFVDGLAAQADFVRASRR